MIELRTDFVNDELTPSMDGRRQYEMQQNANGTFGFIDRSAYSVVGSNIGANEINQTNEAVNGLNDQLSASDGEPFRYAKVDGKRGMWVKEADTDVFVPFKSGYDVSSIIELYENTYSVFLSTRGDDKLSYYNDGRYTQRNGNDEPLLMIAHGVGAWTTACIAKSAEARDTVKASSTYGDWRSNKGTSITPKGHTVYWGYGNGGANQSAPKITSDGKTYTPNPFTILMGSNGVNAIGLMLADILLFDE